MAVRSLVLRCVCVVAAAAALIAAGAAQAQTQNYRFSLGTPSTVPRYVNPLSASPSGPFFKVETDARGRVAAVDYIRGGASKSRTVYDYAGASGLPVRSTDYQNGESTSYETYQYYAAGDSQRSDRYTAAGKLTGFTICTAEAGAQKSCDSYTGEAKLVRHKIVFYDANNIAIRQKYWDEGGTAYHVATYNPQDGLEIENDLVAVNGDKPLNFSKMSYDANGDRLRRDGFDGVTRQWFASIEYQDDEAVKKSYKYPDGSTYVALHHYDTNRLWSGSDIIVNGVLLFRFVYVRQPDGTVIKSQAIGVNGDLWAEYPNKAIDEVDRNGRYTGAAQLGTIYKAAPWW